MGTFPRLAALTGRCGTGYNGKKSPCAPARGRKARCSMGKFDGLLLVSDFDDTLYDSHCRVPPRNRSALEYWMGEGGRFTVATGRARRTFAPYADLAPINAPVVLSNGSAIYDFAARTTLVETLLDPRAPEDFAALMDAIPSLGLEVYHGEDIYVFRPNAVTDAHMAKVGTDYTQRPIPDMPTPWTKAIVQQEYGELLRARDWLEAHCPDRYEAIFSNRYYLEITRRGCNKGGMVKTLMELLHIAPQNLYCVGDNQNDIPMLALSAIPFAPANCAQEVRDWGAEILCHCDEGVIGDIVERLDRLYKG